jgi:hypothetical protein
MRSCMTPSQRPSTVVNLLDLLILCSLIASVSSTSLCMVCRCPRIGTTGSPCTSPPWDSLRPSSTPICSSSGVAHIRYICCFKLLTLSSPYPVQRFCSRPFLPSSGNSPCRISGPYIIFWESLYNIRWTGSSSLSVSLLSIFLSELAWWTASQFQCRWTRRSRSLPSSDLLLLIRLTLGASSRPSST